MKSLTVWQTALIPWYVFAAYWAITALRVKRTKTREKSLDRLVTVVVVVIAYELLFARWLRIGPLGLRFVPQELWIAYLGIALSGVGTALSIWARYCLGEYWSARVTLKEGHQLIRSGPYAWVRHPIYTGILVALAGTAIAIGEYRAILALAVIAVGFVMKAKRDESFLETQFGPAFEEHRRQTGFFLPR